MSIYDKLNRTPAPEAGPAEKEMGSKTFTFAALPESLADLQAYPEAAMNSPFQTAALTVCALCAYAADEAIGTEMLNFLKGPQPLSNYEQSFLRDRFRDGPHVPFSYFAGSSPENDYTPSRPFTVTVSTNSYSYQEEGYAVLWIASAGADSPRQVKLRRKGDQWFLWEQMLTVGIRKPKSADPWA